MYFFFAELVRNHQLNNGNCYLFHWVVAPRDNNFETQSCSEQLSLLSCDSQPCNYLNSKRALLQWWKRLSVMPEHVEKFTIKYDYASSSCHLYEAFLVCIVISNMSNLCSSLFTTRHERLYVRLFTSNQLGTLICIICVIGSYIDIFVHLFTLAICSLS